MPALYHIIVPNTGGGTRRDGGYDCRFCATANAIPVGEMPQGLVLHLPSREQAIAALVAKRTGSAAEKNEPTGSMPQTLQGTPKSDRADAKPLPKPTPTPTPTPTWIVGLKAREALIAAFDRAVVDPTAICTAFLRTKIGRPAAIDPTNQIVDGNLLAWLDRNDCELLILGGSETDGRRWKAVFHPLAGAASFVLEPASL